MHVIVAGVGRSAVRTLSHPGPHAFMVTLHRAAVVTIEAPTRALWHCCMNGDDFLPSENSRKVVNGVADLGILLP
jgi:hypothetical protein